MARDTATLLRIYATRDRRFTTFEDHPPYTRLDGDAFRRFLAGLAEVGAIRVDRGDLRIDLFGKVAVATGVEPWELVAQRKAERGVSRFTMVLLRQGRRWRVVHEHFTRLPEQAR
jgi:ketosteroid isomerase-like protein